MESQPKHNKSLYAFIWQDEIGEYLIGYVTELVVCRLIETPIDVRGEVQLDRAKRTLSAFNLPTEKERSSRVAAVTAYWRDNDIFPILRGWRDEPWPVYGLNGELLFNLERSASGLFGVTRYGVHMVAFVPDPDASHGLKIWIGRRAANKATFPGMLDNAAAGGMPTGEVPLECIIREASEEADLDEQLLRERVKFVGNVSYMYIAKAGMVCPEVQWTYELELPAHVTPRPGDGEVEEFILASVEDVKSWMAEELFKPNCAVVLIDFFVRRGIFKKEHDPDLGEVKRRIRRTLPFPGPVN